MSGRAASARRPSLRMLVTIAFPTWKDSRPFSHPGFSATEKAQIKNANSKAIARKQPTAPAFDGFGFFLPRAALNFGIQVNRAGDYAPSSEPYSRRSMLTAVHDRRLRIARLRQRLHFADLFGKGLRVAGRQLANPPFANVRRRLSPQSGFIFQ